MDIKYIIGAVITAAWVVGFLVWEHQTDVVNWENTLFYFMMVVFGGITLLGISQRLK